MAITLTSADIREADPCDHGYRSFRKRFGHKVIATVSIAVAHAGEFDWYWAATAFLKADYYNRWCNLVASWSWDPWYEDDRVLLSEGHLAHVRYLAASFAELFLAQGGVQRERKRR
jgi:hypothetical protein